MTGKRPETYRSHREPGTGKESAPLGGALSGFRSMSEADLQRLVTDALEATGWQWLHVRPGQTRHGWRVPVSGPLGAGWPDLYALHPGRGQCRYLELKAERGRLTPEQERVHATLREAGFRVDVIRPSTVDAWLEEIVR